MKFLQHVTLLLISAVMFTAACAYALAPGVDNAATQVPFADVTSPAIPELKADPTAPTTLNCSILHQQMLGSCNTDATAALPDCVAKKKSYNICLADALANDGKGPCLDQFNVRRNLCAQNNTTSKECLNATAGYNNCLTQP